jgi:hypothetical protein
MDRKAPKGAGEQDNQDTEMRRHGTWVVQDPDPDPDPDPDLKMDQAHHQKTQMLFLITLFLFGPALTKALSQPLSDSMTIHPLIRRPRAPLKPPL